MDVRVFPQLANGETLLEVTCALALNITVGVGMASIPLLTVALAVSALALVIIKPQDPSTIRSLARFSIIHLVLSVTLNPLIHECGHAVLALALFKDAGVQIRFLGFGKGAVTSYVVSRGLTPLGKRLGKELAVQVVAAGGMLATLFWTQCIGRISLKMAVSQTYQECAYALDAIGRRWDPRHDYMLLHYESGINPVFPLVCLVANLATILRQRVPSKYSLP